MCVGQVCIALLEGGGPRMEEAQMGSEWAFRGNYMPRIANYIPDCMPCQGMLPQEVCLSLTLRTRPGKKEVLITGILDWETYSHPSLHERNSQITDLVLQGCIDKWLWQQGVSLDGVQYLNKLRQKPGCLVLFFLFCSFVPNCSAKTQHYFSCMTSLKLSEVSNKKTCIYSVCWQQA